MDFSAAHSDPREREGLFAAIRRGNSHILYVPLYAAQNEALVSFIKNFPGGIRHVVIEEAHGVSRREASRLVKDCKPKVVLCQTDQCSEEVFQDICGSFTIERRSLVRLSSVLPPNLEFRAVSVLRTHDKYSQILQLLVCSCDHHAPHHRLKRQAGGVFACITAPVEIKSAL